MFKFAHTYTHKKMLDCAIYILKQQYAGPNYVKVRIKWFNRRGMDLGITETIKIKRQEIRNWYEI